MKLIDLSGQHFGRLTVLSRVPRTDGDTWWLCQCDCGTRTAIRSYVLRGQQQQGCGCLRVNSHRQHGLSDSREFHAWSAAKQRCTNPKASSFQNYGARGIRMCDAWMDSAETFLRDMGPCPKNASLDRIDTDGPYSPENCRWATKVQQANNTRRNRILTVNGRRFTLAAAAREFGIPASRVVRRLNLGWSDERAVS